MRAYENIKFEEFPDVGDIQSDGRASHVGRLPEKSGDYKPYIRSKNKKATRRTLKRRDKAITLKNLRYEEEGE